MSDIIKQVAYQRGCGDALVKFAMPAMPRMPVKPALPNALSSPTPATSPFKTNATGALEPAMALGAPPLTLGQRAGALMNHPMTPMAAMMGLSYLMQPKQQQY